MGMGSTETRTINHCLRGSGIGFFPFVPLDMYTLSIEFIAHTKAYVKRNDLPSCPFYPSDKIEFHLNRTKRNKRHRIAQRHREEKEDDEDGEEEENTIGIYLLFDFVI